MSTRSATTAGRYTKRAHFRDSIWGSSLMITRNCNEFFRERKMPVDSLFDLSVRQYAANIRKLQQQKAA